MALISNVFIAIIKTIILKIFKTKKIDNKKKTIISLTTNVIKYLIVAFVVLSILNVYGVNTTSIVASIRTCCPRLSKRSFKWNINNI